MNRSRSDKIARILDEINNQQRKIQSMKDGVRRSMAATKVASTNQVPVDRECADLNQQLGSMQQKLWKKQNRINVLEDALRDSLAQHRAYCGTMNGIRAEIKSKNDTISSLEDELEESTKQNEAYCGIMSGIKRKLKRKTLKIKTLQQRLDYLSKPPKAQSPVSESVETTESEDDPVIVPAAQSSEYNEFESLRKHFTEKMSIQSDGVEDEKKVSGKRGKKKLSGKTKKGHFLKERVKDRLEMYEKLVGQYDSLQKIL